MVSQAELISKSYHSFVFLEKVWVPFKETIKLAALGHNLNLIQVSVYNMT